MGQTRRGGDPASGTMDDALGDDVFNAESVETIVRDAIENVLGSAQYNTNKVTQWTNFIVEDVLKNLQFQGKPFKYIVNCLIMQNNGSGLHMASSCFWDTNNDGSCTVRFSNDTMHCHCTVFGIGI